MKSGEFQSWFNRTTEEDLQSAHEFVCTRRTGLVPMYSCHGTIFTQNLTKMKNRSVSICFLSEKLEKYFPLSRSVAFCFSCEKFFLPRKLEARKGLKATLPQNYLFRDNIQHSSHNCMGNQTLSKSAIGLRFRFTVDNTTHLV